jgi:adenylosuccinate synthase
MITDDILECIKSKVKNSEKVDHIPQRILVEGAEASSVVIQTGIPTVSCSRTVASVKTISVSINKVDVKNIHNNHPMANLCSTSKVFENLISINILRGSGY